MTFLGLFLNESLLEKKDASGSHLLPDMYMRIVQIEPKLVMQAVEHDKLAEILKEADEIIEPEVMATEDIVEFERIDSLP